MQTILFPFCSNICLLLGFPNPHTNTVRSCQIDFLLSVTNAHAKKLDALNLFIKKLARQSFLFIIGEKKEHFSYISILIIFLNKH